MVANHPQLRLDAGLLDEVIEGQIGNISELVRWRLVLRRGAEQRPEWRTTGHELLAGLLREKQSLATERLFRALGLRYRQEDLAQIYQGLRNASTRDSGLELLHGVLPKGLRETVLALVDGEQDAERAGGVSADAAGNPAVPNRWSPRWRATTASPCAAWRPITPPSSASRRRPAARRSVRPTAGIGSPICATGRSIC